PGAQVELEGRPAVVRAVGAGRVQVDYNHPLAGRTLVYDISIEKLMDDGDDKMLSFVARRIPEVQREKFNLAHEQNNLIIDIPEEAFYLNGLQVAKKQITSDLQKYFPKLNAIAFKEVYKRGQTEDATSVESGEAKEEQGSAVSKKTTEPVKEQAKKTATGKKTRSSAGTRRRASKTKAEEE
ncbi:MAG TPA: hypothetical protein VE177_01045, partial [Candidatus Binatus sp.]|nr:hypothetical protein [Candidatus Binatus sp.]